jgi:PAS domain S-box-containing protein
MVTVSAPASAALLRSRRPSRVGRAAAAATPAARTTGAAAAAATRRESRAWPPRVQAAVLPEAVLDVLPDSMIAPPPRVEQGDLAPEPPPELDDTSDQPPLKRALCPPQRRLACVLDAARFSAVLRAATEHSIVGTTLDGRITVFNAAAERLLGYRCDEVVGLETALLLHDPAEIAVRAAELGVAPGFAVFTETLRQCEADTREWTYVRKDGRRLPVSLTVTSMKDDAGQPFGYIGVARDITRERELERQKDEFLANVSHDLRTPLTGIKASIGVVVANLPPEMPQPLRRLLVNVDLAAERMAVLVDDLLELTRLRSGIAQIDKLVIDLRAVVQRAARGIEPLAAERGQRLEVSVPDEPVTLLADAHQLERALTNLLSNASKHGFAGGLISLSLSVAGNEAHIAVSDDGPGIPEGEQERIFDRFYRLASSAAQHTPGSGLGLPIARAMVELHGGRIWVKNNDPALAPCPDHPGATFYVALSLDPPPAWQTAEKEQVTWAMPAAAPGAGVVGVLDARSEEE